MIRFILVLVIFVVSGCSHSNQWRYLPESPQQEKTIFVVDHGWHTGIVISGKDIGSELAFLRPYFGRTAFYELGWGDREFYQSNEITSGMTVRAMFWPTPSVMHIVAIPRAPKSYFSGSKTLSIKLSPKGHQLLRESIAASFKRDKQGKVIKTKPGIYGRSFFFEGEGNYYMTNTCNTWTARVLYDAGLPVRPFLTLTAGSVMDQSKDAMSSPSYAP